MFKLICVATLIVCAVSVPIEQTEQNAHHKDEEHQPVGHLGTDTVVTDPKDFFSNQHTSHRRDIDGKKHLEKREAHEHKPDEKLPTPHSQPEQHGDRKIRDAPKPDQKAPTPQKEEDRKVRDIPKPEEKPSDKQAPKHVEKREIGQSTPHDEQHHSLPTVDLAHEPENHKEHKPDGDDEHKLHTREAIEKDEHKAPETKPKSIVKRETKEPNKDPKTSEGQSAQKPAAGNSKPKD